jgi:hypothetical protein
MGAKAELAVLRDRVAELERQLAAVTRQVAAAGPLIDDATRLDDLAARADRLSASASAALHALQDRAEPLGHGLDRFVPTVNTVYRAAATGYVSAYYAGGRSAAIVLLAGPTDPPTEHLAGADTTVGLNTYVGGVVRRGEYWVLSASNNRPEMGFRPMFTPLF